MTHDDIYALLGRMIANTGTIKLAMLDNTELAQEMVRQKLATRDGAVLVLTGNGWFTGRKWWPSWVHERVMAIVHALISSHGKALKMSMVSASAQLDERSPLTRIAWQILTHACMGCFAQVTWGEIDGMPDGIVHLDIRGYSLSNYAIMLSSDPWQLLPIGGGALPLPIESASAGGDGDG